MLVVEVLIKLLKILNGNIKNKFMILGVSGKAGAGKDTVCKMMAYTLWYYKHSQRLEPFSVEHYEKCSKNYVNLNFQFIPVSIAFFQKCVTI